MAKVLTKEKSLHEHRQRVHRENQVLSLINRFEWPLAGILIVVGLVLLVVKGSWVVLIVGCGLLAVAYGHYIRIKENVQDSQQSKYGRQGEVWVSKILSRGLSRNARILNDITVKSGGKSAQIDHLIIASSGLFVIETKNWKGVIRGDENSEKWEQIKNPGSRPVRMSNPISQNQYHIDILTEYLKAEDMLWDDIFSIITYLSPKTRFEVKHQSVPVLDPKGTVNFIRGFESARSHSDEEISSMVSLLLKNQ